MGLFASTPAKNGQYTPMRIESGQGVQPGDGIVAVTGASGFVGSHIVKVLLEAGYDVRAVVRNPDDQEKIAHLQAFVHASADQGTLTFAKGDLLVPGSFDQAFAGVVAVVHCAAVVEGPNVANPYQTIVEPSVQGSVNVYDSVDKVASIRRVVHTSSIAAIQTYDKPDGYVFSEEDWNDWSAVSNGDYYGLAKVKAEEIAHRRAEQAAGRYDVTVINPSIVFGQCFCKAHTKASPVFIRQLLYGNRQGDVFLNWVDAKDVASAHLQALRVPEAGGKRFVITGDGTAMRFPQLASELKSLFPDRSFKADLYSGLLFDLLWYAKLSEFEKQVQLKSPLFTNQRSKEVLQLQYTPKADTLTATVASMLDTGFVKLK